MRYLPTIDLWAPGIQAAITSGQIRLQPGQWVRCGSDKRARYVSHNGRSFNVVHWQGDGARTRALFMDRIACQKLGKLYQDDKPAWRQAMAARRSAA